jgi:hypothetical protein
VGSSAQRGATASGSGVYGARVSVVRTNTSVGVVPGDVRQVPCKEVRRAVSLTSTTGGCVEALSSLAAHELAEGSEGVLAAGAAAGLLGAPSGTTISGTKPTRVKKNTKDTKKVISAIIISPREGLSGNAGRRSCDSSGLGLC